MLTQKCKLVKQIFVYIFTQTSVRDIVEIQKKEVLIMERVMDSMYGVVIFYIIVAILTFAVTICMKNTNESENVYETTYVAYSETANIDL